MLTQQKLTWVSFNPGRGRVRLYRVNMLNNVHEVLESFEQILSVTAKENKTCYIMGGYNLDQHHPAPATNVFIDLLFSCTFHPLITKPIRITSNSTTLIGNILTIDISSRSKNSLIINDLSDHLPVFTLAYTFTSQKNSKERICFR